jgi:RsiW-degrading membrane proteinase PrsW (M82 family)
MNLEELKSNFNSPSPSPISKDTLLTMLDVNQHPTLKAIKIQLMIESIFWMAFLACFYNFFDGHLKPAAWNIALALAVGLLLVHNSAGYKITNNPINGINIAESLTNYCQRLKKYAYLSIASRALAISIMFGYFLSGLASFEQRHYISLGIAGIVIAIQVVALWRIWSKRISTITSRYEQIIEEG